MANLKQFLTNAPFQQISENVYRLTTLKSGFNQIDVCLNTCTIVHIDEDFSIKETHVFENEENAIDFLKNIASL